MSDVTDLEAAETAGTIPAVDSPLVAQVQSALSAIAKLIAIAGGGTAAALTLDEAAALPIIADHAGLNGSAISNFAASLLAGETPAADPTVAFGLAHAQASLSALALGAANALGIT